MSRTPPGTIWSPKYPIRINGETMNLFDARDRGLIDLHRDKYMGYWSYRVFSTGEVVSWEKYLQPKDHSEWYREAMTKGPQT